MAKKRRHRRRASGTQGPSRVQKTPPSPLSSGAQQPWWKANLGILVTITAVVALIGLFLLLSRQGDSSTSNRIGDPVPAAVLQAVTQPDPSVFAQVGTGGLPDPLIATGSFVLKGPGDKPEVFYYGAEYCPYCAAERWSLVMAMSRFGEYQDLQLMESASAPEAFPTTNTFSFQNASYASDYVDWASVESADRTGQPLQTPTTEQQAIIKQYDAPPYTQTTGSIPFVSYANQYISVGAGYNTASLQGLSWEQIAAKLSDPNEAVTKDIVGNANYMTAAICQATNQQPASVCQATPIPSIEQQIAKK